LHKPKAAVTVDGKSILQHQLEAYAEAGVEEVFVIVGYKADILRRICQHAAKELAIDVDVIENENYPDTENMYSLSLASDILQGEEFLLSNGDVVYDKDIISKLVSHSSDHSYIASDAGAHSTEAMKVRVEGNLVTEISKSIDESEADAVSIDLYRFSSGFSADLFPEIMRKLANKNTSPGWTEIAINELLSQGDLDVRPLYINGSKWVEIDNITDLLEADLKFNNLNIRNKKGIFVDLDGTVWLENEPLSGAVGALKKIKSIGINIYFLSNNSSKWKNEYVNLLQNIGIETDIDKILLSTDGVLDYLTSKEVTETYVVGTESMREAFRNRDINVTSESPSHVIIGFDKELTYDKVRRATLSIRNGAEFLVAHSDKVCPTSEGLIPDCGSISALIEAATGQVPTRVFGKPNSAMVDHILTKNGWTAREILVIGDRLETDVQMARNIGCDSICVLSGDADRLQIELSPIQPSTVIENIGNLNKIV
jgi:HAD superfamily hydrolase (TIGR01450 family)